jgi:hypothetical protein
MTVVGSDVPKGLEVKWYAGGVATEETVTVSAAQKTAGVALSGTAEYGSVMATVNGAFVGVLEWEDTISTKPASEATGTGLISYPGIEENDVLVIRYIATDATALTQVASSQDVSCSSSADTLTAAVNGQANKLVSVGSVTNTATMKELVYNQAFVSGCQGNATTNSPTTGKEKWTNAFSGMKKIGALVGKRLDASGTVIYKWFLVGATATGLGQEFPTSDYYSRSLDFQVDYFGEVDLS